MLPFLTPRLRFEIAYSFEFDIGNGNGLRKSLECRHQDHRRRPELRRPCQRTRQRRPQGSKQISFHSRLWSFTFFRGIFVDSIFFTIPIDQLDGDFVLYIYFRSLFCLWNPPRLTCKMEGRSRFLTLWNLWITRLSSPSSSRRELVMFLKPRPWIMLGVGYCVSASWVNLFGRFVAFLNPVRNPFDWTSRGSWSVSNILLITSDLNISPLMWNLRRNYPESFTIFTS